MVPIHANSRPGVSPLERSHRKYEIVELATCMKKAAPGSHESKKILVRISSDTNPEMRDFSKSHLMEWKARHHSVLSRFQISHP
jgi:hypothetical protein